MGFFWSGPNASVSNIFKRSARYWVNTYVHNCLYGPPGRRSYGNGFYVRNRWGVPVGGLPVAMAPLTRPKPLNESYMDGLVKTDPNKMAFLTGEWYGKMSGFEGWSREDTEKRARKAVCARIERVMGESCVEWAKDNSLLTRARKVCARLWNGLWDRISNQSVGA